MRGTYRGGPPLLFGRPQDYQTYRVSSPLATHFRPASCADVDCPHYLNGWQTMVPADSPQAEYIRAGCGRRFTEERTPDGLARFVFEAGQACFEQHMAPLGREPLYLVRHGVTGNSRPLRAHTNQGSFVDDLRSHLERIERERE